MENLIRELNEGNHSLVVESKGKIYCYDGRGISDLLRLLAEEPELLSGSRVADKIVGKAAAGLMLKGGVIEIYAELISTPAKELIKKAGVKLSFTDEVHHIVNRTGTDCCPMEKLCYDLHSPEEIYIKVKSKR